MADLQRNELGDFLRSRRESLNPRAVGLPVGRRRRTAGLRRQEVAELAGIGVDWYIRMEQGRAVSPSVTTIDALARALRLTRTEHTHLRTLARSADRRAFARETVPEPLERMIRSLNQPAYITGRRWDILAWNDTATELFGDFGRIAERDRNILLYMLTSPDSRRLFATTWEDEARRVVAQFRTTHDLWAGDPAFSDLLERVRQGSPEFAAWWKAHDVRNAGSGQKLMVHPAHGPLRYEYTTFQANDDPALKLAIYAPLRPAA
ncbi:MAG: helix-turn-helix transcriptional regulator [Rhodopila sp.]